MNRNTGLRTALAGALTLGAVIIGGAALADTGAISGSTTPGTAQQPTSELSMAAEAPMPTDRSMSPAASGAATPGAGHHYPAIGPRHLRAVLHDVNGAAVASIAIDRRRRGGNEITIDAWHLSPGFHGLHLHAAGVCDPTGAKPFASAGGHFNPTGSAEGMQAGAFPVLLVGADGHAHAEFLDSNFALADLVGPAGTSVVVHSAPDNYANIPTRYLANGVAGPDTETMMTGDGGSRVACAVLSAPAPASSNTH
jgi:superoxide dismutase, Cu-Zn family